MKKQTKISVVIPVYGCVDCLNKLFFSLKDELKNITDNFEIIFINDASPDGAWEEIKKLSAGNNEVKGIDLSRNFGQHQAITAGLEYASGEWIIVMDCDLQDKPDEISLLFNKSQQGFDVVLGRRKHRKDSVLKKIFSKVFYFVLGYLTDTHQDAGIANFGIYHHKVVEAVLQMNDQMKYFPAMVKWVGFKSTTIDIQHGKRESGKTSYSIKKLLHLGIDVIISFSEKPLKLTIKFGLLISISTFFIGIIFLVRYYLGYIKVLGYSSLILSIWFLSGIIIFILGIVGLYLGKTFEKVKDRPAFIIREKLNLE